MLCSKVYGNLCDGLAEEVSVLAKQLCTRDITFSHIESLVGCRLIPLMKVDNGIRPVGVHSINQSMNIFEIARELQRSA